MEDSRIDPGSDRTEITSHEQGSPPTFKERVRQWKIQRGLPVEPRTDRDHGEALEEGVSRLNRIHGRPVTLHPDGLVRKSGSVFLGEADAIRFVRGHGLPVPHIHEATTTPEGKRQITMDYIEGDNLEKAWPDLSESQKKDIALQLREVLNTMRSLEPPLGTRIGAYSGGEIRESRFYADYTAPSCQDENEFNDYLVNALLPTYPPALRRAFSQQLRTDHRIVFTHGHLIPRNLMVRDGKLVGVLEWDEAGWYPEYWEYVKFFQHFGTGVAGWWWFADDIFEEVYSDELVDYTAMSRFQWP